jgi:hypothetical protein
MTLLQIVPAVLLAAACHVVALRVATRLMVDVRIPNRLAVKIVAIEYAATACIAGLVLMLLPAGNTVPLTAGALAYLFVGAACIGIWIAFSDGTRVGLGNGVLIQAIQIPLIIPVVIAASFLFDLAARLSGG